MGVNTPPSRKDTLSRLVLEILCGGVIMSLLINQISDQIHLPLLASIPLLVLCLAIILLFSTNRMRSALVLLFLGIVASGVGVLVVDQHSSLNMAKHGGSPTLFPSPVRSDITATSSSGSGIVPTLTPSQTTGSGIVPTLTPSQTTGSGIGPTTPPTSTPVVNPQIDIHYAHGQVAQTNMTVTTSVACSPGEVLVGGGANVAGTLFSDYPSSSSEWSVEGSGSYTGQVVDAWAVCLANTNHMSTIIETSASVPILNGGDARISCPSGYLMVGGGYRITPSPTTLFRSDGAFTVDVAGSTPMAGSNGWDVFAYGDANERLITYVVCAQNGPTSSTILTSTKNVSPQRNADITATCPSDRLLTSGGGADTTTTSLQSMALEGSFPTSGAWDYRAYDYQDATNSHQGQVYIVCVSF